MKVSEDRQRLLTAALTAALTAVVTGAVVAAFNYFTIPRSTTETNRTTEELHARTEESASVRQTIELLEKRMDSFPTKNEINTQFEAVDKRLLGIEDRLLSIEAHLRSTESAAWVPSVPFDARRAALSVAAVPFWPAVVSLDLPYGESVPATEGIPWMGCLLDVTSHQLSGCFLDVFSVGSGLDTSWAFSPGRHSNGRWLGTPVPGSLIDVTFGTAGGFDLGNAVPAGRPGRDAFEAQRLVWPNRTSHKLRDWKWPTESTWQSPSPEAGRRNVGFVVFPESLVAMIDGSEFMTRANWDGPRTFKVEGGASSHWFRGSDWWNWSNPCLSVPDGAGVGWTLAFANCQHGTRKRPTRPVMHRH